jgi:long-subunit acyl-CoA synthetase (AMP-forming)/nucleoside-diphosphate-sugar epimerase/acyl carrier protein
MEHQRKRFPNKHIDKMIKKLFKLFSGSNNDSQQSIDTSKVTYQWCCDSCLSTINSGNLRYKSLEYDSYDLCETCYEKELESNSELYRNGWFISETKHRFELKELVRGNHSNETLNNAFVQFSHRPCFGVLNLEKKQYEWISYKETHERVLNFAAGLVATGLVQNVQQVSDTSGNREFVAICARNCLEWFVADYACFHKSLVSVPIHYTLTETDCSHIIQNANVSIVICTSNLTQKFVAAAETCPTLKFIIEMDRTDDTIEEVEVNDSQSIKVYSFKYIENAGKNRKDLQGLVELDNGKDLVTLIYTSGSTGTPKGVMVSDRTWNTDITKNFSHELEVAFSFTPLAHMSDRKHVCVNICNGSLIAIFQREMTDIFEDIQIIRPTTLVSTPRLWNIIYGEYQKQLEQELTKLDNSDSELYEKEKKQIEEKLLEEFKKMLGNRIRLLITGGAPTALAVIDFLRRCYKCHVSNGFGATEAGGIMTDGYLKNNVEYKLIDVPEMNYFTTDKPYPRGELCVKTETMFSGYYNNPELTSRALDADGWYHTQDIVEHRGNRKFAIIDRLKNIFKLAQGEFVAPEYLENTYLQSPFIDQIFIYGNTLRSYVVAVVIPNRSVLLQWANTQKSLETCMNIENEDMKLLTIGTSTEGQKLILSEFTEIASRVGLQPYEIPRAFILEPEVFTNDNGRMTGSMKIARAQCEMYYKDKLEQLYEQQQSEEARKISSELNTMLNQVLGTESSDNSDLLSTGIDSLHAVRFANFIQKKYNIALPLKYIMGKTTLNDVTDFIMNKDMNSIQENTIDWIEEMKLEDDIRPDQSVKLSSVDYNLSTKNNILITGVTGFLGTFLLNNLLDTTNCDIHCLIRVQENDSEAALERIVSQLKSRELWNESYRTRIKPLIGDLSQPLLGLSSDQFKELSQVIDVIYHNGAHVNSVLSYEELKDVNVESTRTILRLAVAEKLKIVHYVSTIGVVQGVPSATVNDQDLFSSLESESQMYHRLSRVSGYSSSKYVAECLCHEARSRGVPLVIYRPGMIGPDTIKGACNTTDWVVSIYC